MSIKFSALPPADTPLSGDEILCVVQDGISKQVAAAQVSGAAADPTALVGLDPVPGAAVTLMRSDAAPALDQAIEPVWTGEHQFQAPVLFSFEDDGDVSSLTIASDEPSLDLTDTDQDAGLRRWKWAVGSSDFPFIELQMIDEDGTVLSSPISISRGAGGSVVGMALDASAAELDFYANETVFLIANGVTPTFALRDDGTWGVGPGLNTGSPGQVLQSNGDGIPVEWNNVALASEDILDVPAGIVNNQIFPAQRVLVSTTAGPATLTGFAQAPDGTLVLLTNIGPSDLVLASLNGGSVAANQMRGPADITVLVGGSKFLCYSGILSKWVMV